MVMRVHLFIGMLLLLGATGKRDQLSIETATDLANDGKISGAKLDNFDIVNSEDGRMMSKINAHEQNGASEIAEL